MADVERAVIRFVKMQGIGNDYIYVDVAGEPALEARFDGEAGAALVRGMSDRHRGIGGDGVILVGRARGGIGGREVGGAHVRMRMFNSDGSESEMCGNGVRCVAKFAHDRLEVRANPMRVETGRGVLSIEYRTEGGKLVEATVDMGEPIFDAARIPVRMSEVEATGEEHVWSVKTRSGPWLATFVSMGNPHAVMFVDEDGVDDQAALADLKGLELARIGPEIEHHPAFPRRVNAHFVATQGFGEATMRTWERGAGATQACGTGACAVVVAGVRTAKLARDVLVHLPGGDLRVRWDEGTGRVLMTGPAEDVFEGVWAG